MKSKKNDLPEGVTKVTEQTVEKVQAQRMEQLEKLKDVLLFLINGNLELMQDNTKCMSYDEIWHKNSPDNVALWQLYEMIQSQEVLIKKNLWLVQGLQIKVEDTFQTKNYDLFKK